MNSELHDILRLSGGGSINYCEESEDTSNIACANKSLEHTFRTILKNTRSLTSDERILELQSELEGVHWDAVLVNETWRDEREEYMTLSSGDVWCGSGGTPGKHGVGILLHERWSKKISG